MKDKIIPVIAIVALVLAGFSLLNVYRQSSTSFGAINAEDYIPVIKYEGYNSAKPITLSGPEGDITTGDDLTVTDDATILGGSLTVTTAANATSTLIVGGIQTYATSSETTICMMPTATTTNIISGASGTFLWKYGTCPF